MSRPHLWTPEPQRTSVKFFAIKPTSMGELSLWLAMIHDGANLRIAPSPYAMAK
jgi:hypothetical protein